MQMPLRDGGIFSFSDQGNQGTVEFEMGSYGLDSAELRAGAQFEELIRLDGIGEFAIPEAAQQAVEQMPDSSQFTAEQRGKALLGKMLEMGCRKVWSPPTRH